MPATRPCTGQFGSESVENVFDIPDDNVIMSAPQSLHHTAAVRLLSCKMDDVTDFN